MGERGHTGRDRPILFSAPMVRALLEGRKTQTRRVLKPQPYQSQGEWLIDDRYGEECRLDDWVNDRCGRGPLVQAGDRLWVREAFRLPDAFDEDSPVEAASRTAAGRTNVFFEADGKVHSAGSYTGGRGRLRASMHMPRWASRLTLTVTDVRVQRLTEISDEDALAEGVERGFGGGPIVEDYLCLWNSIHGPFAADKNPWVAAYTFTVERRNIDAPTPTGEASDV